MWEIEEIEGKKSLMTKQLGDEIKKKEQELREVAREVNAGKKWVEVEVARNRDYGRRAEEVVRLDTGEVIETRTLTPAECQAEFDLQSGAVAATVVAIKCKGKGAGN